MTVGQIHTAVITAYKEAISEDSTYKNCKIVPIDRETEDVVRGQFMTEYDANYSREMGLRVTTLNEDLYYYARSAKKWKKECNDLQELLELRLLKGIGEFSIDDIQCETGHTGETGGVLHVSFTITFHEIADFDGREAAAEYMDTIDTSLTIHTNGGSV